MAAAWARAGLVVAVVLGLDQVTKALVVDGLPRGARRDLFFGIDLVHVRNKGIAFGLHARRPFLWLPTGLLLGGALGNLLDRAREGAVTDFIDVPLWPAFNVADMAITAGVLALLLALEAGHQKERPSSPETSRPEG